MIINHEARYWEINGLIYTIIVRIDQNGTEEVVPDYSRYFVSMSDARKSVKKYIKGI